MLYIITYATHNERYFELLKQSYKDIIVLGWNMKWNGYFDKIQGVLNFCKDKNDDDIILFIDGFNSVIIHTDDIIEKYKSFNSLLVFSKEVNPVSVPNKYLKDSYYGLCQLNNLYSGLYIGTSKAIIEFWKDMKINDNDQIYATKKCNLFNDNFIKIDVNNKLFYNYNKYDKITIDNYKITYNLEYPNIISAPDISNINDILRQLGYDVNNINIKNNKTQITNYISKYPLEIIFLIIIIGMIYFIKDTQFIIRFSIYLFLIFINYSLYIKHLNISFMKKIIYLLIDLSQLLLLIFIHHMYDYKTCNYKKILLLNIINFIIIISFFLFKKCIFNLLKKNLSGIDKCASFQTKLNYVFNKDSKYIVEHEKNEIDNWINFNMISFISIIMINYYCLVN